MSDYISRADTLAKIKEYCIDGDSVVHKWFDTMGIEEVINTMPSVSAERVGEWIWCGDKGDSRFMCSVCKCKENVPTCMGEPTIWDYCPNCGAKMRGAE